MYSPFSNRNPHRPSIRNFPVFAGALCTLLFPGLLRLHTRLRHYGNRRFLQKLQKTRPSKSLSLRHPGPRSFPCAGRLSLLDELHAGEFPKISHRSIPNRIQLQFYSGRGNPDSGSYFYSGRQQSTGAYPTYGNSSHG